MKEIGGYIEIETNHGVMLHDDALALNCGRNCLVYLIKAKRIKCIALPYFLCDSVISVCHKYNIEVRFYHINKMFQPEELQLGEEEWLYVVNYYGQLTREQLQKLKKQYEHIIVDYAQAYFEMPIQGIDSLYTCRKFFGVADGAFLYTDVVLLEEILRDESYERMHFLVGRFERPASDFYSEYVMNNNLFNSEPLKLMSKLTENLLRGIDYEYVKKIRTENFTFLFERLRKKNKLQIHRIEGAFAYPLMLENNGSEVRKKLIANKIYIPTLWPNVMSCVPEDSLEYMLARDILPIPCDQRYRREDMEYICEHIERLSQS